jgi:hypothetical protein
LTFIKKLTGASAIDAGSTTQVGGVDWNKWDDFLDDIDLGGPVGKVNTTTRFRSGKFKLRNPADTFSYAFVSGALVADRNINYPVLAADDIPAFLGLAQTFTGNQTFAGGLVAQGALSLEAHICPTQITADQNDYNPTGLSTTAKINLNADSSFRTITGLAGGATGRMIKISNVSANTILLANENAGSTAANRFDLGGYDIPLFSGSAVELSYDEVATRWRIMDQPSVYIIPIARQGVYAMAHYVANTSIESGLFSETAATGGSAVMATATAGHHGVLDLTLGTSATGSASSKVENSAFLLGNLWYWKYEAVIKLTSLSSADPDYTFRSGFIDSPTAESTDGVFFRYNDNVNAGEYQLVARSNNTETATDTNTVPVAGNWTRLTIIVNPAGTSAQGFINGSSIGTVASNIPTGSGRACGAGVMFLKTAGTTDASLLQIDSQEVVGYANVSN